MRYLHPRVKGYTCIAGTALSFEQWNCTVPVMFPRRVCVRVRYSEKLRMRKGDVVAQYPCENRTDAFTRPISVIISWMSHWWRRSRCLRRTARDPCDLVTGIHFYMTRYPCIFDINRISSHETCVSRSRVKRAKEILHHCSYLAIPCTVSDWNVLKPFLTRNPPNQKWFGGPQGDNTYLLNLTFAYFPTQRLQFTSIFPPLWRMSSGDQALSRPIL